MEFDQALIAISALSQETRLRVFRILVEYGKTGAPAGTISERLGVSHNNLSFHLSHLSHAGLVTSCKSGRSVIYCANTDAMKGLVGFLNENCCTLAESEGC
ncbi:MAG: metalloregulator ArsR/SmtB family transcription factor [Pseudomonadota bacterium]